MPKRFFLKLLNPHILLSNQRKAIHVFELDELEMDVALKRFLLNTTKVVSALGFEAEILFCFSQKRLQRKARPPQDVWLRRNVWGGNALINENQNITVH